MNGENGTAQGRPGEQHSKHVFLVTGINGDLRKDFLIEEKRTGSVQRGTAKHSVIVVCFRKTQTLGEVDFLAFRYSKEMNGGKGGIWTPYKFPAETQLEEERPIQTATNCMRQEVAADSSPNAFRFRFLSQEPFYTQVVQSDKKRGMVGQYEGKETIGPPQWIEAAKLLELMEQTATPTFHRVVLLRALNKLGDPEIQNRYRTILFDDKYQKFLS